MTFNIVKHCKAFIESSHGERRMLHKLSNIGAYVASSTFTAASLSALTLPLS